MFNVLGCKQYGWAMSQKSPVDGVKRINDQFNFHEKFVKCYDEDSDKGYILKVDVKYLKHLHNLPNDLQKHNDFKAFIEYSHGVQDVYKKIKECNQEKKRKELIYLII